MTTNRILTIIATMISFLLAANCFAKLPPNICNIVNTPQFNGCLGLSMKPSMCGFPPRPCVKISYNVPSYYIEVVKNPGETYFAGYGGVASQLGSITDQMPTDGGEDHGEFSFAAHSLTVPFVSIFQTLPCGGVPVETYCLGAMSEHLGANWRTGAADLFQPNHLAWASAPKACLVAGSVQSAAGGAFPSPYPSYPTCSFDRSTLTRYPPSSELACNGWGMMYPRYQTSSSSDQTTASLLTAAKFKSLANEVFGAMPSGGLEAYQMIFPQPSACFSQGQNIALLRGLGVNEIKNSVSIRPKNYLYAIWRRTSCTVDYNNYITTPLTIKAIQAICRGNA